MLCVQGTRRDDHPKPSCPMRARTFAERASFRPLRLLPSPRRFAASFRSLRHPTLENNGNAPDRPPLTPFVKTLHASAALRGTAPALTRSGFALAHCGLRRTSILSALPKPNNDDAQP